MVQLLAHRSPSRLLGVHELRNYEAACKKHVEGGVKQQPKISELQPELR